MTESADSVLYSRPPLLVRTLDNQFIGGIERARRRRWHDSSVDHGDAPLRLRKLPAAPVLADDASAMKAVLAPGTGGGELKRSLVARHAGLKLKDAPTHVVARKQRFGEARSAAVEFAS